MRFMVVSEQATEFYVYGPFKTLKYAEEWASSNLLTGKWYVAQYIKVV